MFGRSARHNQLRLALLTCQQAFHKLHAACSRESYACVSVIVEPGDTNSVTLEDAVAELRVFKDATLLTTAAGEAIRLHAMKQEANLVAGPLKSGPAAIVLLLNTRSLEVHPLLARSQTKMASRRRTQMRRRTTTKARRRQYVDSER